MFQTCAVSGPLNGTARVMDNLAKLLMECDVCAQARNPTESCRFRKTNSPISPHTLSFGYVMTDQNQMYAVQGYYPSSHTGYSPVMGPVANPVIAQQTQTLNMPQYMSWGPNEVLTWMLSLENGRLRKYQDILRQSMERSPIAGYDLPHVNMLTARQMGIYDVADQDFLLKQVSAITHPTTPVSAAPLSNTLGAYGHQQMYSYPANAFPAPAY